MFSYGKLPYPGLSNAEVADKVLHGYHMEAPSNCPTEVYTIMTCCWVTKPEFRPSFGDLLTKINELLMKYQPQESPVVLYDTIYAKASHYN